MNLIKPLPPIDPREPGRRGRARHLIDPNSLRTLCGRKRGDVRTAELSESKAPDICFRCLTVLGV